MPEGDGWRVESGQEKERRRYLFLVPCARLRELGEEIDTPLIALKLCRPGAELMAELPPRWRLTDDNRMMIRRAPRPTDPLLAEDFTLVVDRDGAATRATIADAAGQPAARGYALEAGGVFIYDRIVVEPDHRRRGLGRALMAALGATRIDPASREVLTATCEGRALYLTLGWEDHCHWATAMIPH